MAGCEGLDLPEADELFELGLGGESGLEGATVAVGSEGREGLLHGAVGGEEQERVSVTALPNPFSASAITGMPSTAPTTAAAWSTISRMLTSPASGNPSRLAAVA